MSEQQQVTIMIDPSQVLFKQIMIDMFGSFFEGCPYVEASDRVEHLRIMSEHAFHQKDKLETIRRCAKWLESTLVESDDEYHLAQCLYWTADRYRDVDDSTEKRDKWLEVRDIIATILIREQGRQQDKKATQVPLATALFGINAESLNASKTGFTIHK
jgi:hypothetical protein